MTAEYRPEDLPDWGPIWAFPAILWRVPYWPVRLYLHAGDRVLFWLWWQSRAVVWRIADVLNRMAGE